VSNFIKTKHPKEGENKEQKERTHAQARKEKWSTNWASKRSGKKSHIGPHYRKKHVRRGEGRYTLKNTYPIRTLTSNNGLSH
jgi:hypothetical protein